MPSSRWSLLLYASFLGAVIPASPRFLAAQAHDPVRVIRSDTEELVIEITPQIAVSRLPHGELNPRVDGATLVNSNRPGEPMRLELRVGVALPSPSGSTLDAVTLDYGEPISGSIAPVPHTEHDSAGFPVAEYRASPALYAAATAQLPSAELRYSGIARDVHAGFIAVNPVLYDPVSNTLRLLQRATLRLRFPSVARSARLTKLSEITRGAFINSAAASSWVLSPKTRSLSRIASPQRARAYMRVDVRTSGLYALAAEDFQRGGVDLAGVDASRIAVYATRPGGLSEESGDIDSNRLRQLPVRVERGSDGRATRVLFYASGPFRWEYVGSDSLPTHTISPYSFTQSYIVGVDGEPTRELETVTGPASYDLEPTWGIGRMFYDDEKINAIDVRRVGGGSGRDWYATEFTVDPRDRATDMRTFVMSLPGLERTAPVHFRIRVANGGMEVRSGGEVKRAIATFRFWQQDAPLGAIEIGTLTKYFRSIASTDVFSLPDATSIPSDGRSSLKIEFSNPVASSGFLDFYEIHYGRRLVAENDTITFDAPSGVGVARFRVGGFSGDDIVGLDVTDPLNPVELERKPSGERGVFIFHDQLSRARDARRYFIARRSAARRVEASATAVFGELRERPRNADILVVTHEDLRSSAQKYVDYRNSRGALRAAYATTEEIYTEYSSGTLDPTAIRDYIGQAFNAWDVKPQYVIFLGDATYDYRNIVTTQKQLVPTMQLLDGDFYHENISANTDDYYVRLTSGDEIIDKLIRYETTRNFGAWRHTAIMTADDDMPCDAGGGFIGQSEGLIAGADFGPMTPRKIYLSGYPTEKVPTDRKPGATADLMQFVNRGAVVTNFIGHGNPKQWAHELLLEKDQFIPRMDNDSTPTFIIAATCNFGAFDDPMQRSGAEELLSLPSGGAIALIGSTRASDIWANELFAGMIFRNQFTRESTTGTHLTIGAALMRTKSSGLSIANSERYHILGDPSMRLNLPENLVTIDSINGIALADSAVTIGALSVVSICGSVVDPIGHTMDGFDGTVIVSLDDAERSASAEECDGRITWRMPGGRLFRGPARVVDGRFRMTFRVPMDIAYDSSEARIHAYAFNAETDAAGFTRSVRVYGSETTTVTDTAGPVISIFLDDRSFRSGDVVTQQPVLIVDLSDTSGINSSGSSLGHRIEAWVDGSPNSIDLTEFYQTGLTDYRVGSAERTLLGLEPGEHAVRVRAWDIFNNPREGTALFRITEGGDAKLVVTNVVNYPNPMERQTEFTFQHNQSRPLDVEIAVFTFGGRKVRTLEVRSVTERFVRVPWDGTDADGSPMANGVYFYRIRVSVPGSEEAGSFESIEKVAIVR